MLYQARYFQYNPDSRFVLLSDNVKHPFNEFLLLTAEFGLFALVAVLLLIAILVRVHLKHKGDKSFVFISAVFAIVIFSCLSYPFKYPFTWIVAVFSICSLLALTGREIFPLRKMQLPWLVKIVIALLPLALTGFIVKDIHHENQWYNLMRSSFKMQHGEIIADYERLLPYFNNNGYFLYNYAAQLNLMGKYERSLEYVYLCSALLNDYDIQMLIADNYENLREWDESLEHYESAFQMCPGRFMPLYRMTLIFDVLGQKDKSRELAQKIVDKEVKIPSVTVNRIKALMRTKLQDE